MLVLNTRKESKIFIGNDIVIHCLGEERIGIDAPIDLKILRGSVARRIEIENADVHNPGGREISRGGSDSEGGESAGG